MCLRRVSFAWLKRCLRGSACFYLGRRSIGLPLELAFELGERLARILLRRNQNILATAMEERKDTQHA